MALLASAVFLLLGVVTVSLVLLMIMRIGYGRLESAIGIARDGPRRERPAPAWQATDNSGHTRRVPCGGRWQLLIFADHCLASFPDLVAAMNRLPVAVSDLDVAVLARSRPGLNAEMIVSLGITAPVVMVDQGLYDQYKARVMPFSVLIDDRGIVKWKGVANNEAQLRRELRLARAESAEVDQKFPVRGVLGS
jgi:hypothetical protein